MFTEQTQYTFFILSFLRSPVFLSFRKNRINLFRCFSFTTNSYDIQFSCHHIDFDQVSLFYQSNGASYSCLR